MTAKFWVGGTGTWDNSTTTHWSLSTGGAGGAAVPTTGDAVTFDGASGGGTVTVDTTVNGLSLLSITAGAFTGTLDFSVNNPSMTITSTFNASGAGTRTINLGSGTFTLTGSNANVWDATTTTGLTLSAASATFSIVGPGSLVNPQTFAGGGKTYGTLNVGSRAFATAVTISGANTFAALNLTAPLYKFNLPSGTTTITNAIAWNGTSSNQLFINGPGGASGVATLAVAAGSAISWAALAAVTFTGATVPATNSFDLQNNIGATITPPSAGGSHMIGG